MYDIVHGSYDRDRGLPPLLAALRLVASLPQSRHEGGDVYCPAQSSPHLILLPQRLSK